MPVRGNNFLSGLLSTSFIGCCLLPLLISCSTSEKKITERSQKFDLYYIQGEKLYSTHCSNCHQKNGKGLGRVYPPLDSSDYMTNHVEEVICLIKYGKEGELLVNGKLYNQRMQGIEKLTPLEIAEISTYIYNTWTNDHGLIDVKQVELILQDCATKKTE
ncbi:MAG: cytochrome c [Cytophagia bacterium]|nr:cytochrome c [Cytophagia bacterium]